MSASKFTDYSKLMYLARTTGDGSDFQCSTRAGVITEWNDARPQPTYDEIEAVDPTAIEALEAQEREDRLEKVFDPMTQAKVLFRVVNEIRSSKGQAALTKKQFLAWIDTI